MKTHNIELYKQVYDKHKNLKLAASELNMKWQTLYWHLSAVQHPVVGDKEKYGSTADKMAKRTENLFNEMIPYASDANEGKFQALVDFDVKGHSVDIKGSCKNDAYKNNPRKNKSLRWAFSCKVQEKCSDFLVCYCYEEESTDLADLVEKILLIPKEFYANKQSFSVSCNKSKWYDFEVSEEELLEFFDMLPTK